MEFRKAIEEVSDAELDVEETGVGPGSHWVYDREKEWYTLSKPISKRRRVSTTKFSIITPEEFLDIVNDSESKTLLVDSTPLMDGRFLIETVVSVDIVTEEIKILPKVDLPKGVFEFEMGRMGDWGIKKYEFSTDKYIDLSSHTKQIQDDIVTFLAKKNTYHELNLLHKRGILLYGPPGTGKTMLVEQVARTFSDNARIFFGSLAIGLLPQIKDFLSDVPMVVVLEEITQFRGSDEVLSLLDGEQSIDGCLVLGTTNYPQHIPGNLIDRPGRFDSIYEVGLPNAETRRVYLETKLGEKIDDSIIDRSEGLTLAYLKELVVATKIYNKSFAEIFNIFSDRKNKVKQFRKFRTTKQDDDIWEP